MPKVRQLLSDNNGDTQGSDAGGNNKYSFLEGRRPAPPIRDKHRRAIEKHLELGRGMEEEELEVREDHGHSEAIFSCLRADSPPQEVLTL